ncbi:MAG: phosphodiesterase [Candidatus Rokuibacteriota bacterium]|nr:MAG: phosphodiesterase [Candidatus Rokubacteria bacterium]
MPSTKVVIVGLDCAEPSLVLERWRDQLPTVDNLMQRGAYGPLRSVIPPITVPAWSCMMASRTPGDLGIYGFRNRADHSYDSLYIADGAAVREPRLWDLATRHGKSSIVLGVPGTYPPRPFNGYMVSCFLTPSTQQQYTYPPLLRKEVEDVVGEYLFDCTDFRTEEKGDLLRQVYDMTDRRFQLAGHLIRSKPWELFVMVEMGIDRMHHGFWKHMDPDHRKHEDDSPYADAILDYHRHVDGLIGQLLDEVGEEAAVLVVSDHGAKRMDGGIRVNEWLRREGYLYTLQEPNGLARLSELGIDWSRTVAWGEGGYYSRIFMNVRDREPNGLVAAEDYEEVRTELAARLEQIPDELGRPIPTRVYKPEEVYPQVRGVPPDLIVHFGDLHWRSVGTVGGDEGVQTFENDTGPDDANHAQDGLLVMVGPGVEAGPREGMHLLDVAPTVLEMLGLPIPESMRGRSLLEG